MHNTVKISLLLWALSYLVVSSQRMANSRTCSSQMRWNIYQYITCAFVCIKRL